MKYLVIILLIFCGKVEAVEDSYFLSCNGAFYLKDPVSYGNLIKTSDGKSTYEIRNKNLYIPIAHSRGVSISPVNYGEHKILYFAKSHPQYSFMQDYYLSFDRISGTVNETHTQTMELQKPTTHLFQGQCTVLNKKQF